MLKDLLNKFRTNRSLIEKIYNNYSLEEIIEVALKNQMYDVFIEVFKPIEVGNTVRIYYDYFSYVDTGSRFDFYKEFSVPDDVKKKIEEEMFKIDIDKIKRIKIKDSLPRQVSGFGHPINSEFDVIYYAEPACLETMLYLYRNNIETTMNDTECVFGENKDNGVCTVWINYETLSDENKKIMDELVLKKHAKTVESKTKTIALMTECSKEDTVNDVSNRLLGLAKLLQKQISIRGLLTVDMFENIIIDCMRYGGEPLITILFEYIEKGIIKPVEIGDFSIENTNYLLSDLTNALLRDKEKLATVFGFYYDIEKQQLWESEQYYKEYLNSINAMDSSENIHKPKL